jgi:hypothetical protein
MSFQLCLYVACQPISYMNIKEIERGIEKTGFRLEFDISNILEDNGWTVINNKYYVDDLQSTV